MTYKNIKARSAMTAIAAVLALSSTPLAAQETTAPDPVTETPSNPPPVADPLAPEPTTSEPAASETEPAATAAPATTRRAPARSRTTAASRAPSQPVRTAAPASAPAPASEAPAEALPVPPVPAVPAAETPIAEATPPPVEPVPGFDDLLTEDSLPYVGAAGLGLLALAGFGLAVRRRRRREELEHHRAAEAFLDQHQSTPMPNDNEPAFVRAGPSAVAAAAPEAAVRTDVPQTKLPDGFDLSRFGPHVRAAYRGPTPDNPSLSLKYRVRRAAAMDRLARQEDGTPRQAEQPAKRPEPAKQQPAWSMNGEGFLLRRAGSGQPSRPAFQK